MDKLINDDFFQSCCDSFYDELFQLYGKKNQGFINFEEFKSLTICTRKSSCGKSLEDLFCQHQNSQNKIDFQGFMNIMKEACGNNLTFDSATLHQTLKSHQIHLSYKVIERMVNTQDRLIDKVEFPKVMSKINHYWEEFQIFDLNKDGLLDFGEMIKALEKYSKVNNVYTVIDETKRRFSTVDINRDGCIDFSEFIDMIEMKQVDGSHAVVAFTQIDRNGDGFISKDELVSFLRDIGDENCQESARKMIGFVDKNLDDRVSFNEFQKIFQHI